MEPFAGGASVTLAAVGEGLVDAGILYETDPQVAAVWETIIHGNVEALMVRIATFDCTLTRVTELLATQPTDTADLAFQTIVRNRVQRGGILAPGAGLMKAGEKGKGIASRWYPETLVNRITHIASFRERLTFHATDGVGALQDYIHSPTTALFLDPPYTAGSQKPGQRLYTAHRLDHDELFQVGASAKGPVLLTYNNTPDVQALAEDAGLVTRPIAMRNAHNAKQTELLIAKDFSWQTNATR